MGSSAIKTTKQSRWPGTFLRLAGDLIALVLVIGIGYPQDHVGSPAATPKPGDPHDESDANAKRRRLETVMWNPTTYELTWVVSEGNRSAGIYLPLTRATYLVHMDSGIMHFNGEDRRISDEEAQNIYTLMNILSQYAIESTIRWELGPAPAKEPDEQKEPAPRNKEDNNGPDATKLRLRPARVADPHSN
jgi:hypothetical protein